jgi:hypothetical protein
MMTPTFKLRFVERSDPNSSGKLKILQQWWEDRNTDVHWLDGNPGEWRDVPTGEE